jgi:hypothetical protein
MRPQTVAPILAAAAISSAVSFGVASAGESPTASSAATSNAAIVAQLKKINANISDTKLLIQGINETTTDRLGGLGTVFGQLKQICNNTAGPGISC